MRFAPTDVGFIADPYRDYEELRAIRARRLRRGDRPLADLPVRRRRRAVAGSALRPHVPAHRHPRGDGPPGPARLARAVLGPDQRRDPRHGATRSHARAPARIESLHSPVRRVPPPAGARDLRGAARDGGGRGGVRPAAHARGAAARDRDRGDARRPRGGPSSPPTVVGRHREDVRAAPDGVRAARRRPREPRVLRLPPRARAATAHLARGRPDLRPGPRDRRGRDPHGGRARRDVRPPAERRPRGDGERDAPRLVGALPPSRPAEGAPRRPVAAPDRDRGAPAVPDSPADVRAVGARAVRAPRGRDPEGSRARLALRLGEPRPGRLRGTRRPAPGPPTEPASHVRRRDPLLPRGPARPHGAADLVRHDAGTLPPPGARGGAAVPPELHHPRARGPAGPHTRRDGEREAR